MTTHTDTAITGKVVVITGASSGLGEATARYLAERGATVVLGARRAERLQTLVDEITRAAARRPHVSPTSPIPAQVQALVDAAVEQYGRVDVMLNNAGVMPHSPLERRKIDDWNRTIDINIKGVLYGIAAALPHMQRQKAGHIINVSSVAGHKVGKNNAVYAATKTAVRVIYRRPAAGGQAVEPAHDDHLAGRSRDGVAEQHHRGGRRERHRRVLRGVRDPGGVVRARRGVRDRSARRCRHQRDSLPADAAGALVITLVRQQFGDTP